MNFEQLGVHAEIVKALQEENITEPTLIQEKAIPQVLLGKDFIGRSKTGSGKTAAFGIPAVQLVTPKQGVQLLVLAPVRELVVQIAQELQKFGKYLHLRVACVYGGVSLGPQIEQMERAEIVVSTPGRLLDHLERRTINVSTLKCVVLDEADKMVEMGFIEDIERIMGALPREKQVLLFGATISEEIDRLKRKHMHDPVVVEAEVQVQQEFLQQYFYTVQQQQKFSLLVHLLKKEQIQQGIVFCSARSTVELVAKNLRQQGIKAEMIHGKLSQSRRLRTIEDFHHAGQGILVASAVAARGLHIDDVSHVFNYDLSQDPQEYVHRVGRTARAGKSGKAITLLSERDFDVFRDILSRYRLPVEELPLENFHRLQFDARREFSRGRDMGNSRFGGSGRFGGRSNSYHRNDSERRPFRSGSGYGSGNGRGSGGGGWERDSNYGRGGRTLPSAPGWRK